jgi:hypothetical protein
MGFILITSIISLVVIAINLYLYNQYKILSDKVEALRGKGSKPERKAQEAELIDDYNDDEDFRPTIIDKIIGRINVGQSSTGSRKGEYINTAKELIDYLKPEHRTVYDEFHNKIREVEYIQVVDVQHKTNDTKELIITFTDGSIDIFEKDRFKKVID